MSNTTLLLLSNSTRKKRPMSDTTGWTKCYWGEFHKDIGNYRFRLWRGYLGWRVSMEYIELPATKNLNDAKRLAHKMARELETPND